MQDDSFRREKRFACSGLIDIFASNKGKMERYGAGLLNDISESGARIQMDVFVSVGTELILKTRTTEVRAVVRNVSKAESGFFVGVEFSGGFKWDVNSELGYTGSTAVNRPGVSPGKSQPTPAADRSTGRPSLRPAANLTVRGASGSEQLWTLIIKQIQTAHGRLRSTLRLPPACGDIADRARSETALTSRIARDPLGISLFEDAPVNAVVLDRQLDITYANTEFTRVFGSVSLLTSRAFLQFVVPEDIDRVTECALMSVSHSGVVNAIEFYARAAKGRALVMSSRWRYSEATDTTIVHLYDVTEQKNEERELLAILSESEGGKSTVRIAGWSWDVRTETVYCSREWAQIYGLEPRTAKLERAIWMSMIHPDDRANIAQILKNLLSGQSAVRAEFRVIRPDGSVAWLASRGHVIFDTDRQPVKAVGETLDITEHKMAQLQRTPRC